MPDNCRHFYDRNSQVRVSSPFGRPDSRNTLRRKLYIKQQPPSAKTTGTQPSYRLLLPVTHQTDLRVPHGTHPGHGCSRSRTSPKLQTWPQERPESLLYLGGLERCFARFVLVVILSCVVHDTRCVYDCWLLSVCFVLLIPLQLAAPFLILRRLSRFHSLKTLYGWT